MDNDTCLLTLIVVALSFFSCFWLAVLLRYCRLVEDTRLKCQWGLGVHSHYSMHAHVWFLANQRTLNCMSSFIFHRTITHFHKLNHTQIIFLNILHQRRCSLCIVKGQVHLWGPRHAPIENK